MRQPELGKKVAELRKAKGLTQEELVETCNISVRTLQRIETGEVMPRSYTLKTILAALDNDLHTIEVSEESFLEQAMRWFRSSLSLTIDLTSSPEPVIKQLNAAWMFGILYLLVGFIEGAADYFRYKDNILIYGTTLYVTLKIAALVTYIFFQRGFILVGGLFKNYLLRITSTILILGNVLIVGYDIASVFYNAVERQYVLGSEAVVFGCLLIVYGISLRRLKKYVGSAATYVSVFEILAGCFFLTLLLSFMGYIMLVPAELCEIIILYKSMDLLRAQSQEVGNIKS